MKVFTRKLWRKSGKGSSSASEHALFWPTICKRICGKNVQIFFRNFFSPLGIFCIHMRGGTILYAVFIIIFFFWLSFNRQTSRKRGKQGRWGSGRGQDILFFFKKGDSCTKDERACCLVLHIYWPGIWGFICILLLLRCCCCK